MYKWVDGKFQQQENIFVLTKMDAQVWLCLFYLVCEPACARRYQYNSYRREQLVKVRWRRTFALSGNAGTNAAAAHAVTLIVWCGCGGGETEQLRRHFNEILLDQLPPLMDLHRAVEMLSVTDTPATLDKPALLLETVSSSSVGAGPCAYPQVGEYL